MFNFDFRKYISKDIFIYKPNTSLLIVPKELKKYLADEY